MNRISNLFKFTFVLAAFFMVMANTSVSAQATINSNGDALISQNKETTVEIAVTGMTCQIGCADGIDRKLKKTKGIVKSSTKIETGICKVTFNQTKISVDEIISIIEDRGYEAKVVSTKS